MRLFAAIITIFALTLFSGYAAADDADLEPVPAAISADGDTDLEPAPSAISADSDTSDADAPPAKRQRITVYDPARIDSARAFSPSSRTAADMFRSDGTDPAEMLRYRALTSVFVPHTLSGSMNRLLHYGNPIPAERYPYMRTDYFYHPYPSELTGSELLILWETGPFSQNSLNLRLSRPLSPSMMISLFSNYRYLQGQRFNHERNDIVNFYSFFNSDTASIMNRGYNPLVDEHMMGAALSRRGADSSVTNLSFSFVNLQNEYALNIPVETTERLEWARRDRGLFRIDAALLDKNLSRRWRTDVRAMFINETDSSSYQRDTSIANGRGGSNSFILDADFILPNNLGVTAGSAFRNTEHWNGSERFYSCYRTGIFYTHRFRPAGGVNAKLRLRAEMLFEPYMDTVYLYNTAAPPPSSQDTIIKRVILYQRGRTGGTLEFMSNDSSARLRLYTGYDTARYADSQFPPWFDFTGIMGAEGEIRFGYLGLLAGYQHIRCNSCGALQASWPEGFPPYALPAHTFIIAPWVSRYHGFSLLTRAIITDTRPYLKASANLSYLIKPRGMTHTFEPEVGFNYWSMRDPVYFAGHWEEWYRPIYDLNLKITAHIREFRLFYKVDNLLNLRQAYVPGYFSPGLTFRWGINWFIQ
jgi:hypothetical protein